MAPKSAMVVPSSSTSTGTVPAAFMLEEFGAALPHLLDLQLDVDAFFLEGDADLARERREPEMIERSHGRVP